LRITKNDCDIDLARISHPGVAEESHGDDCGVF
jgi:hypothetical protein